MSKKVIMPYFRSRISVVLLVVIVIFILPVIFLDESVAPDQAYLAYGILGLVIGLITFLLFALRYEIGESQLIVKLGPITYCNIKLSDIESIQRSYNPLSSPAASLKRLLVTSGSKSVLISPMHEEEFIRLIKSKNPNVKADVSDKADWWRFWDWDI